jgi:hypothetical protein
MCSKIIEAASLRFKPSFVQFSPELFSALTVLNVHRPQSPGVDAIARTFGINYMVAGGTNDHGMSAAIR